MAEPHNICKNVAERLKTANRISFSCTSEMRDVIFWETVLGDLMLGTIATSGMEAPGKQLPEEAYRRLIGHAGASAKQELIEIFRSKATQANVSLVKCMCGKENFFSLDSE